MDKQAAREILSIHRPGTDDPHEPQVAEALAMAKQDPELGQWFQNQRDVHAVMRRKLGEIPVPQDLKREILRAEAARRGPMTGFRNAMVPLAAAAVFMLLAAGLWTNYRHSKRDNFVDFRERLVRESQRMYGMVPDTDLNEIHTRLLAQNCPDYSLSKSLAKLPADGYATPEWHGRKVSMVCLHASRDKQLFLFVMNDAEIRNAPASGETEFAKILHLNSASRVVGDKIYILAGSETNDALKQYLD